MFQMFAPPGSKGSVHLPCSNKMEIRAVWGDKCDKPVKYGTPLRGRMAVMVWWRLVKLEFYGSEYGPS